MGMYEGISMRSLGLLRAPLLCGLAVPVDADTSQPWEMAIAFSASTSPLKGSLHIVAAPSTASTHAADMRRVAPRRPLLLPVPCPQVPSVLTVTGRKLGKSVFLRNHCWTCGHLALCSSYSWHVPRLATVRSSRLLTLVPCTSRQSWPVHLGDASCEQQPCAEAAGAAAGPLRKRSALWARVTGVAQ